MQVKGVGQHHLRIGAAQLLSADALTVAAVPTGMKRGVSTTPGRMEASRTGGYGDSDAAVRIGTEQQCSTPKAVQLSPYGEAQDGSRTQALMLSWWPDLAGSWIFYTTLRSGLGQHRALSGSPVLHR